MESIMTIESSERASSEGTLQLTQHGYTSYP
jgi:hypothetical protein